MSHTTIDFDTFFSRFKPAVNPKMIGQVQDNVMSMENHRFEPNCKTDQKYIDDMLAKHPNRVWTEQDVEGQLIISSGCHFVDRFSYIVTEVPYDYDVIVEEPTDEFKVSVMFKMNDVTDEDAREEMLSKILDIVHDGQYLVKQEYEIKPIPSFDLAIGFGIEPEAINYALQADLIVSTWADDNVNEKALKELFRTSVIEFNDEESAIEQFVLTVNKIIKPEQKHHNCPACGSKDIEARPFDDDESTLIAKPIVCNDCNHKWSEVFKFVSNQTI